MNTPNDPAETLLSPPFIVVLAPVRLEMPWGELLGDKRSGMPDDTRRERWQEWLGLCDAADEELAEMWRDARECCEGCIHLAGGWCNACALPATYNPVLRTLGMACCGAGKECQHNAELSGDQNP